MDIKTLIQVKITKLHIFAGLSILLIIVTMVYSIIKYNELTFKKDVIAENQLTIEKLKAGLDQKKNEYYEIKKEHDESQASLTSKISKIFPDKADQNNLLRQIEDFFAKNHLTSNYFLLSSISFGAPTTPENANYTVLPISMNIESSPSNFYKFLSYIETSGSLENEVRIMEIANISLNFTEDSLANLNFSVSANAYSQKEIAANASLNAPVPTLDAPIQN